MQIMYVRTGYDNEFLTRLGSYFAKDNEVTYIDMVDGYRFYYQLVEDILRIGPHIVHSTAYRHPLFVSQIVTGIPTIVEVTDDLSLDMKRFACIPARDAVTDSQLDVFTMMQASCLITSRESPGAMGVYNARYEYIPEPLDHPEVTLACQDGCVGVVGRGELLRRFVDERIAACSLHIGRVKQSKIYDKLCCIIIEPGFDLSLVDYSYLCTLGVPVAFACGNCANIDSAFRFIEYSTENIFDSVVKVWQDLAHMSDQEYTAMVARVKLIGDSVSMGAVYKLYARVYERAIEEARIRMPVRGW